MLNLTALRRPLRPDLISTTPSERAGLGDRFLPAWFASSAVGAAVATMSPPAFTPVRLRRRKTRKELLPVWHPAFGRPHAEVWAPPVTGRKELLSTLHPAFGDVQHSRASHGRNELFSGPVTVGGFFFAVDPMTTLPFRTAHLNPHTRLTVRDQHGAVSRIRYRCDVTLRGGPKVEALVRLEVGWIAPAMRAPSMPQRIQLGRGFDLCIPYMMHFTMVHVLDELGHPTGSCLYFSGTPWVGFAAGISRIDGGSLTLDPADDPNPEVERRHFFGKLHYRQLGFVAFKAMGYALTAMAASVPALRAAGLMPQRLDAFITDTTRSVAEAPGAVKARLRAALPTWRGGGGAAGDSSE